MSESRNWSATGEQMKNALSEALQSGNFKNLNDLVSQTVTDAVNEVGKHISFTGNTGQAGQSNTYGSSAGQAGQPDGYGSTSSQIGRASCRERV